MQCPNCGNDNRDGAKFCDECGTALSDQRESLEEELEEYEELEAHPELENVDDGQVEEAPAGNEADEPEPAEGEDGEPASSFTEARDADLPDDGDNGSDREDAKPSEPSEDEHETQGDAESTQAIEDREGEETPASGHEAAVEQVSAIGADLAGFDKHVDDYGEGIVGPGYRQPTEGFRDGETLQMPRIEPDEVQKSKEYLASSKAPKPKRGNRNILVAIVAVVVLAAIVALVTYQMQLWGGKVVPDVTGMTEADAVSILDDEGFATRSEKVKSDDTEGLVLIMDPSAGSRVEPGSEVVIHIATARTIPDIVGKTKEEAEKSLEEAGYTNVKFKNQNSDKKKGTVLSVKPKAGERAKSTAEITVKLAAPYTVPDVSGMALDEAIAAIEKAGLGYESVFYDTDEYPEGTVVNTEPAAGTEVVKGTYVVINVAQAYGTSLEQEVYGYLSPGATVSVGGTSYTIESLDAVSYSGNNVVAYSATARPFAYFFGQMVEGPSQQIDGTVTFTADGQIASVS